MLGRPILLGFCLAIALVLGWACGELDANCSPTGQIGSCCNEDSECAPYRCIEELPRGYCSLPCAEDIPCPEDSYCVGVTYVGQSSLHETICLQKCGGGVAGCRDDHTCKDFYEDQGEQVIEGPETGADPVGSVCFAR